MGRWLTIGLTVVGVVVVAFLIAAAIFPNFRVASRDIAIIIMAVTQIIATIVLIIILLALLYAVRAINALSRDTIVPKLNDILETTKTITAQAQETATTVQGTTTFVAERVASPIIRLSGAMAGVRAAALALARRDNTTVNEQQKQV